jgi:hypothetical protein
MVYEKKLRENLAKKLHILEPGLSLVATEYRLRNPLGAKGFVDILARDAFGCTVIVELKRSDTAARQALNELHKYIALFGFEHGLKGDKIRCFVVSTTWHELLIPLAEFAHSTGYQTTGFQLAVSEQGDVISASVVEMPALAEPLKLFNQHAIYLFKEMDPRDRASGALADAVIVAGVQSCCIVNLDYQGKNNAVIYRYASYVVPGDLPSAEYKGLEAEVRRENEYGEDDEVEADSVEGQLLSRVDDDAVERDAYEVGYPEKFASITSTGWEVRRIWRRGRIISEVLYTDADLLRLIAGLEGENSQIFNRIVSPRLSLAWNEAKRAVVRSLEGNPHWLQCCVEFLREVEERSSDASVSLFIYNPLNLPIWLFKLATVGASGYLPMMEIIADDRKSNSASLLIGFVAWDGTPAPKKMAELLGGEFEDFSEYFFARQFGTAWQSDETLMSAFRLRYVVARHQLTHKTEVGGEVVVDSQLEPAFGNFPLDEYLIVNGSVIHEFVKAVRSCSNGL